MPVPPPPAPPPPPTLALVSLQEVNALYTLPSVAACHIERNIQRHCGVDEGIIEWFELEGTLNII